jgi:hypothetical protein
MERIEDVICRIYISNIWNEETERNKVRSMETICVKQFTWNFVKMAR